MSNTHNRRGFLKNAIGLAGAVAVAPAVMAGERKGSDSRSYLPYEHKKIGKLSVLKKNGEIDFNYPDADSPCKAVHVDGEIKAYSLLCTHKGCPTIYNSDEKVFECPCHYTRYDAEKNGLMIIGHGTGDLPKILVQVKNDEVIAYGVDGLIFGRQSNVL